MTDPGPLEPAAQGRGRDESVDMRLGQHAVGLLQAARDDGDPALIAQAEAMAMAVGFALASRLPGYGDNGA